MKNKLFLLAIGFALTTQMVMAQVPSYVPTNGLVGYWPFNGNANDESGNGNNGTVNGPSLTLDRFGNSNSAYSYSSGANLICTAQNFNNPNLLSYSVWFKTNSNIGGHLIGFNNGQCVHGGNWDRALWVENDKVVFYTFPGFQQTQNAIINVIDNTWHNCVVTMDSQEAKIYVDGVLISSNNTQVSGQAYNGFFRFGGLSPNDINNSLIGLYDDIGVWNRALTQQEITNLYNSVSLNECLTMVINTGALSTNPVTYTSSVNIYPNPANDHITIDCGNLATVTGWSIKITNMLGQEVFNQPMNTQQYVVPLNSWSGQGIYFVKIINAQNEVVNIKKIILQ